MKGVTSSVQTQLNNKAASGHTHPVATTGANGFMPKLNGSTSNYLRGDGTWATPPNTDTTYNKFTGASGSAAGTVGLVPAPAAGASNRYLRSDGTWSVPPDTNTTYTLGSFGITASAAEINYTKGVTSSIQVQLNGKASSSHTHTTYNLYGVDTVKSKTNDTTSTWKNYLNSVHFYETKWLINDQPSDYGFLVNYASGYDIHQLWLEQSSGKILHRGGNSAGWSGSWITLLDSSNYTAYAPSKTGSGASGTWGINITGSANSASSATTATQLSSSAGSATQPVYFSGGKPVACSYTLGKSVPSNAVFTDTNTWIAFKGATTSAAGTAGYAPAPSAGAANRYLRSDGTWSVPPNDNTTYTLGSFGITASAAEINYTKGVTSSIQTQLNGKAASSHSHSTASTSSAGFMPKLNGSTSNYLRGDGSWATPPNTNTDTKVTNVAANTSTAYITGTTSSSTNTGTQIFDTGVYLTSTSGRMHAESLEIGGAILTYDATNKSLTISFS